LFIKILPPLLGMARKKVIFSKFLVQKAYSEALSKPKFNRKKWIPKTRVSLNFIGRTFDNKGPGVLSYTDSTKADLLIILGSEPLSHNTLII